MGLGCCCRVTSGHGQIGRHWISDTSGLGLRHRRAWNLGPVIEQPAPSPSPEKLFDAAA
jgi:hypothetical protein